MSSLGWIDWDLWDAAIKLHGTTIERPTGSVHPVHAEIIYPIDYGSVNGTTSADGEEQDIFVGTSNNGLIAAIFTIDHRKNDRECKLIYNCSRKEVYLINGFINFAPDLMNGRLLLRKPFDQI